MDYKNGRIYQILNNVDDDVYVGSTTQSLSKRMVHHRSHMNVATKQHRPLYVKMKEYGVECFYIELIEECPCENKEQLCKREGHFIREIATLNTYQAGRNQKQYKIDQRERIIERDKQYRKHVDATRRAQIVCACGGHYQHNDKARHFKTLLHKNYEASINV